MQLLPEPCLEKGKRGWDNGTGWVSPSLRKGEVPLSTRGEGSACKKREEGKEWEEWGSAVNTGVKGKGAETRRWILT